MAIQLWIEYPAFMTLDNVLSIAGFKKAQE